MFFRKPQTKNKILGSKKDKPVDSKLVFFIAVLLISGLAILYSASSVVSYAKTGTTTSYYFTHQLLAGVLLGLIAMYITSKIDYHFWQKYAPIIIIGSILLLVAVLIPGIGFKVGNARRWISVGPVFLQPAEFVKLALIIYLAAWIAKNKDQISDFYYGFLPGLIIVATIAFLIIAEPDIGTMLVIATIALIMFFVGGSKISHILGLLGLGALGLFILVKIAPYRLQRLTVFLHPSTDPQGIGYQLNQGLLAIGSGGWFGYGYGHSRQKYNYLPEVIGDSIFAVVVEELGFLRSLVLIGLYGGFAWRGIKVAQSAPDAFGYNLGIGIVSWIIIQALINIGAIIGLLPLTGIPLPFVSYGSSALIALLAGCGILLNISKHSNV